MYVILDMLYQMKKNSNLEIVRYKGALHLCLYVLICSPIFPYSHSYTPSDECGEFCKVGISGLHTPTNADTVQLPLRRPAYPPHQPRQTPAGHYPDPLLHITKFGHHHTYNVSHL